MTNKKTLVAFIFAAFVGIMLSSCYKDHEEILYPSSGGDCSNPAILKGVKFTAVESIIQANCISCHSTSGGFSPNLSTACSIITNWSNINTACVVDKTMPTSGPLPSADQQAITDWVNAGHLYTN